VVVASFHSSISPVKKLEEYYKLAEIDPLSKECLFEAICHTKNGEKLRKWGSVSYTPVRELLLAKLRALGYDSALYGTHSLRAGGATLAANSGIPDRMFKRPGRWRSESAKDVYVKDALEARLEVSKSFAKSKCVSVI
jgi:hypothetical protein